MILQVQNLLHFTQIVNVLDSDDTNLSLLPDDDIKKLAKEVGTILKGNENKIEDDKLADYAIRTLRQFIILHSKGSDIATKLIHDNDEMIGIFKNFCNRCCIRHYDLRTIDVPLTDTKKTPKPILKRKADSTYCGKILFNRP